MAVDAHHVCLGHIPLLGLQLQVPFAADVGQGKAILPQLGGGGRGTERLAASIVEVGCHIHTLHIEVLLSPLHLAEKEKPVLHWLMLGPGGLSRHELPVIASPALHEHEQVGHAAVSFIVSLQIAFGAMDVALHLAAQEQPSAHVAIVAVHHAGSINGREREGGVGGCLQVEGHLAASRQVFVDTADADAVGCGGRGDDEEEAFGEDAALSVEQGELAHTCWQILTNKGEAVVRAGRECVATDDFPSVHHHIAQLLTHKRGRAVEVG